MSTAVERFLDWESKHPDRLFIRQAIGGKWRMRTWREAGREIRGIAAYLGSLNLPGGSNIAILSKNCEHWILADFAIWLAGHVSIPLYPTLAAVDIQTILEHSDSRVIFLGKLDHFAAQKDGIPQNVRCISFPEYGPDTGTPWEEAAQAQPLPDSLPAAEDLATIIYTSGTTGKSKGVMISFQAIEHVLSNALRVLKITGPDEEFFSYLPLSHIAERMLVEMGAVYSGSTISFSESLVRFSENINEIQPTIFLAVPRIWSKFQEKILEQMPQRKLDFLLGIPLIRNIVRKKIRKKLGLSRARWIFTGSAPMRASLLEWFDRLGIVIHDVYAMTENLAYSHANRDKVKYGTVGTKWDDVEMRFSEDGEIQIRHPGLMKGYYREPQLTAETFTKDGFLRTGDLGVLDEEGFLRITGRLKDQFKTDKGKYVAPSPIEILLQKNHDIEHACVVGTGLPQPIALITLSSAGKSRPQTDLNHDLKQTLHDINHGLQSFEQIEKIVVLNEEWTMENGLLTPTLKVKRNNIEKRHQSSYSDWYNRKETIVRP